MGLDYGTRRIGVSLSDPTRTLASPLTVFVRRAGKRPPTAALARLVEEHGVALVVVGLPLQLDGSENVWVDEVRAFAQRLSERSGCPVAFHDERFSSVEAEDRIRSLGLSREKRKDKGRIDAAAATIILQQWLDREV